MGLLALLIVTGISGALAWLAAKLLSVSLTPLALAGAGLFGYHAGSWIFAELGVEDPLVISLGGASIPLLATAVAAAGVVALARFAPFVR